MKEYVYSFCPSINCKLKPWKAHKELPVSQFLQGKPCFHYRKPLFSLQGTPVLIEGSLFSLQGFPCKPLYFPVRDCRVARTKIGSGMTLPLAGPTLILQFHILKYSVKNTVRLLDTLTPIELNFSFVQFFFNRANLIF